MDLPKEHYQEEARGEVKKAMYGARDAAQNRELEYTEMMVEAGLTHGYSACAFCRVGKSAPYDLCVGPNHDLLRQLLVLVLQHDSSLILEAPRWSLCCPPVLLLRLRREP